VKLLSFHLILLSLFLLAPDARRLANIFLLNRAAPASSDRPLFRRSRANRIAVTVQVLAGLFLLGANVYGAISEYNMYGGGRQKSALYGIWSVEDFTLDGQERPPLLTDALRWRTIVFDSPQAMTIRGMNEGSRLYRCSTDTNAKTIALGKSGAKNWKANFSFTRPDTNHLTLDGVMDNHKIHAGLELFDRSKFLLLNRGFHWVQDYPFNR
jgi:hypothetical protein